MDRPSREGYESRKYWHRCYIGSDWNRMDLRSMSEPLFNSSHVAATYRFRVNPPTIRLPCQNRPYYSDQRATERMKHPF